MALSKIEKLKLNELKVARKTRSEWRELLAAPEPGAY